MIIFHSKKIAYFRVPKTASTTLEIMLRKHGALKKTDVCTAIPAAGLPGQNIEQDTLDIIDTGKGESMHMTPAQAVSLGLLSKNELAEYRCFATFREPVSRWRSITGYLGQTDPEASSRLLKDIKKFEVVARPQADYFFYKKRMVCEPVWFDRYEAELRNLADLLEIELPESIPYLNKNKNKDSSKKLKEFLPDELKGEFLKVYGEDVRLYKKLKKQRGDISS